MATRAAPPKRAPRATAPVWYAAPPVEVAEEAADAAEVEAAEAWLDAEDMREDSCEEMELAMDEAADEADDPVEVRVLISDTDAEEREETRELTSDEMEDATLAAVALDAAPVREARTELASLLREETTLDCPCKLC